MISLNKVEGGVYGIADWATHLPLLSAALAGLRPQTVLELGTGSWSGSVLNAYSKATGADVLSLENNFYPGYAEGLAHFNCSTHELKKVESWDYKLWPGPWQMVFIDHGPEPERIPALDFYSSRTDAVILHDCNYRDRYQALLERFRYIVIDRTHKYHTCLCSHDVDVEAWFKGCPGACAAWNWPEASKHC